MAGEVRVGEVDTLPSFARAGVEDLDEECDFEAGKDVSLWGYKYIVRAAEDLAGLINK